MERLGQCCRRERLIAKTLKSVHEQDEDYYWISRPCCTWLKYISSDRLPLILEAAFFVGWGVICRNPWFMMINCHGTRLIARKQLTSPSLSPQEIWPCHKSHRKCASRIQETQQRTQLWGRKLMTRHTNPSCSYHSQILTNPRWGGGGVYSLLNALCFIG